jgi:hypothetical protein
MKNTSKIKCNFLKISKLYAREGGNGLFRIQVFMKIRAISAIPE